MRTLSSTHISTKKVNEKKHKKEVWNMEHGIWNMEHGTWNMKHGTWKNMLCINA